MKFDPAKSGITRAKEASGFLAKLRALVGV